MGALLALCLWTGVGVAGGLIRAIWPTLGAAKPLLWSLLGIGLGLLVFRFMVRPRLQLRAGGVGLAREVERRLGEQSLALVSAVQLSGAVAGGAASGGISLDLAAAHLQRVADRLGASDAHRLAPAGLARWPARALVGLLAATGLVAGMWPQAYAAGWTELFAGSQAAATPATQVLTTWVGDIQLEYRYPAYAGREDRRVEGTDGAILALPGTQVTLTARADRPIGSGQLALGEQGLPLRVVDGRTLLGQILVEQPGSYRFELTSQSGERWRSPRGHPIQVEADRPPRVRLERPRRDLVVRERDAVELLFDARDDIGLDEVRLVWRVVGRQDQAQRRVLKRLTGKDKRAVRMSHRWELASLKLTPGEQVQLFVEATDNDTVSGPKVGRSATVTLKVFSAAEHHRQLMTQVQAFWEQLLAGLADHLEREPSAAGDEPPELADHLKLHKGLSALSEQAGALLAKLRKDQLAWEPILDAVDNIRRTLVQNTDQLEWMLTAVGKQLDEPRPGQLRTLAALSTRRVGLMERDVLYLEDLLDLERLQDLERIAEDLNRAQRRLAELMERYRKAPDAETRREIEAQIARLKQQIAELMKRQREVLKAVRDEYFNPEALRKMMDQRDVMSALDKIQALMMEGKVDEAMKELERLQQQLDQLRQAIDRSKQDFGSQRYREMAEAMARLQAELNQITEQQQRVMDQTQEYRQRVEKRLAKSAGPDLEKVLERLRGRLDALRAKLDRVGPEGLDRFAAAERDQASEQARGLDQLLKATDLARSLEESGKLVGSTERLVASLDAIGDRAAEVKRNHEAASGAAADALHIYRELTRLLPSGRELLRGAEGQQVRALEKRQRELGQRLSQLRSKMAELNAKAPLFGPPVLQGMQRAGGSMRQASGRLGRLDPRAAWPHQRDAMGELEQIGEQMRKACKNCKGGGGMPLPMGHGGRGRGGEDFGGMGGDPSREPVEIPGEDQYEGPEAYRKALLDGMKDPVPEDYLQQVRRYYEELVR